MYSTRRRQVYRRVLCIVQEPEIIGRGGKGGGGVGMIISIS
jgi:hypothetical protein